MSAKLSGPGAGGRRGKTNRLKARGIGVCASSCRHEGWNEPPATAFVSEGFGVLAGTIIVTFKGLRKTYCMCVLVCMCQSACLLACVRSLSLSLSCSRSIALALSLALSPTLSLSRSPFPSLSHFLSRARSFTLCCSRPLLPRPSSPLPPTLNDTTAAALPFRSDRACSPLIITVVPGCKYCIAIGDTSTLLMKIHKLKVFNLKVFIKE